MTAQPDTTELRALAERATPGPWHVSAGVKQVEVVSEEDDLIYRRVRDQQAGPDAAFIAAANPTSILALLDALERAEAKIAAVEALIADGPDAWHPYESRDTGLTFLAESVMDFTADLRAALGQTTTRNTP